MFYKPQCCWFLYFPVVKDNRHNVNNDHIFFLFYSISIIFIIYFFIIIIIFSWWWVKDCLSCGEMVMETCKKCKAMFTSLSKEYQGDLRLHPHQWAMLPDIQGYNKSFEITCLSVCQTYTRISCLPLRLGRISVNCSVYHINEYV